MTTTAKTAVAAAAAATSTSTSANVMKDAETRVGGCSRTTKSIDERFCGWRQSFFSRCVAVGATTLRCERLAAPESERSPYGYTFLAYVARGQGS